MFNYDYIKCDYKLPVSDISDEIETPPDWEEFEFQTMSFGAAKMGKDPFAPPETYTIEEDGQLYLEKVNWDTGEPVSEGVEKQEYSGDLYFFGVHLDEKYDFILEFKCLFWKGELREITAHNIEKQGNEVRKKSQEKLMERVAFTNKRRNSFWYKIYSIYRLVIEFLFFLIRLPLHLVILLTNKIEKWIT